MKSLMASSVIAFALVGSLQAQTCGPYYQHAKCSEPDEPCCSAYGQCGSSKLHCEWTGRYQNNNQTAGSCLYTPCSSKTDCCDRNTGICTWNPDGRSDSENFCHEGGNYNKKEYELAGYQKTTQPATTSATMKPTSNATTTPTSSPKPTTSATMKPTSNATTTPTSSPKPTTSATMKPTSEVTTTPTSSPKPTTSATMNPTSNATTTPTSSPKPTTSATMQPTSAPTENPTSQATTKPTQKPCNVSCPPEYCQDRYCHCQYGNCSEYDDDDHYSAAVPIAHSAMAVCVVVICLAATFAI